MLLSQHLFKYFAGASIEHGRFHVSLHKRNRYFERQVEPGRHHLDEDR